MPGIATGSAQAAPKRGGTLRVAQHDGNTSDQHDPGQYQSNFEIGFGHTVRAYLTLINPDGTLGPDVAKEWSASPDATCAAPSPAPPSSIVVRSPLAAAAMVPLRRRRERDELRGR